MAISAFSVVKAGNVDVVVTDADAPMTAVHFVDPDNVLSAAKTPVVTLYDASQNLWELKYYVTAGQEANLAGLKVTFDCIPEMINMVMSGNITKNGCMILFINTATSVQTILLVNHESVLIKEPITSIKETMSYSFDEESDWINSSDGTYTTPKDWASSNGGGALLSLYPVAKGSESDNTYAKLSTIITNSPIPIIPNVLSGSVFYGDFKLNMGVPLKSSKFGLPITGGYITKVNGKFKYKSGDKFYNNAKPSDPNKKDEWSTVVIIYEVENAADVLDGTNVGDLTNPKVIAYGYMFGGEAADWTNFDVPVYLLDKNKTMSPEKLYKASVIFSSSKDGAAYNGAASELCLDDVVVTYSTEIPNEKPSSLEQAFAGTAMSVYPGVAVSHIDFVGVENGTTYAIYNVGGVLVQSGSVNGSVNVSNFVSGLYFVKVGDSVAKFIKQ